MTMKPALFLLLVLGVFSPAQAAPAAGEITIERVIEVMNRYRADDGLPALREERRLSQAARDRMKDMIDTSYWAHESPDGMSPFVWLRARAYDYQYAAENLAAGYETVELLVAGWMESPGHRKNIMSANFEHCGVAIIDGATTGRASGKSVVVLFASEFAPRLARSASRD